MDPSDCARAVALRPLSGQPQHVRLNPMMVKNMAVHLVDVDAPESNWPSARGKIKMNFYSWSNRLGLTIKHFGDEPTSLNDKPDTVRAICPHTNLPVQGGDTRGTYGKESYHMWREEKVRIYCDYHSHYSKGACYESHTNRRQLPDPKLHGSCSAATPWRSDWRALL